jgi:hypothetical protein
MSQILIDISDEGEIKIETQGFRGKTCLEESRFLKTLLGKEVYRQLTPTFWNQEKKKYLNICG